MLSKQKSFVDYKTDGHKITNRQVLFSFNVKFLEGRNGKLELLKWKEYQFPFIFYMAVA